MTSQQVDPSTHGQCAHGNNCCHIFSKYRHGMHACIHGIFIQYLAECLRRVFSLVKHYFPSYSVRLTGVNKNYYETFQNTISTIAKVFDIVQISLNC